MPDNSLTNVNYPWVLFACCIPTKGARRSVIVDVQRQKAHFVPNSLLDILVIHQNKTIEEIKCAYGYESNEVIGEYFDFLIKNQIVFFHPDTAMFPPISTEWYNPSRITNVIIDIDDGTLYDFESIFSQLSAFGSIHIQLRIFNRHNINIHFLEDILYCAERKRIVSIEIVVRYSESIQKIQFMELCRKFDRILSITVYSATFEDCFSPYEQFPPGDIGTIRFTKNDITSAKNCGLVDNKFFSYHVKTFTESHHHNSCLNRKISIDVDGNIKNCPSMAQSFGNIKDTTLQEALDHPDFKKYWNVTKDQIAVCKDCEFRYICTDCRGYIENPDDMYSKPLKCGYNPYTCEWEEWSTNPLKQKAIDYYGMREVLPEFRMKSDYVPHEPAYADANPA